MMKFKPYFAKYKSILLVIIVNVCFVFTVNANAIIAKIKEIEQQHSVRVGVAIYDIAADDLWSYHGDTTFPLMSTFKTFACAKLLLDVEKGIQSLEASVVITESALITWSPITEKLVGEKLSLQEACSATMLMSDNTAANIILAGINGPKALTQFMRAIGDDVTRLDRIEPELNEAIEGDNRDTTTPNAMVKSLHSILFGDVLTNSSKTQLKQWMIDNKITASLLRSVLPEKWLIADRSGAGGFGSRAINAVVWSDTRTPIIIAIYLTQTEASFTQRNKAIAAIGKEIFTLYQSH